MRAGIFSPSRDREGAVPKLQNRNGGTDESTAGSKIVGLIVSHCHIARLAQRGKHPVGKAAIEVAQ